jgi:glycine cleavage system aminomethyltransferase T
VLVEESGWEIPASYGDDAAEREAIRGSVAIADVTARAKVDVRGRVERVLSAAADALVGRIAEDWAIVLGRPGEEPRLLAALETAAGAAAMVTDVTHLFVGFALAGPRVSEVFARTTSWDPSTLEPGEATGAPVAEIPAIVVRRDLPTAVVELYMASELGRYAWETLAGVVASLGGTPVGWQALRAEGWS